MDIEFDAIPSVESAGRLGRQPAADTGLAEAYRSFKPEAANQAASMLGLAGAEALLRLRSAFGLAETKEMPGIRLSDVQDVVVAAPSYTTYSDCTVYSYHASCTEACFGFEPQHMDPFYCGTCAEQAADPTNNPAFNWHFVGSRGTFQYKDMENNACNGKDAWKWRESNCGECQSALFRCHDGFKKYPENDYWHPTICQGIVTCDDKLKTC